MLDRLNTLEMRWAQLDSTHNFANKVIISLQNQAHFKFRPWDAWRKVDIINFIYRNRAIFYNATNILFCGFYIINGRNSFDRFPSVCYLKMESNSVLSQIGIAEKRSNLLFCVLIETIHNLYAIWVVYIKTFHLPIAPTSDSELEDYTRLIESKLPRKHFIILRGDIQNRCDQIYRITKTRKYTLFCLSWSDIDYLNTNESD